MRFILIGPVYPYRGGIAHYTTMLYQAIRSRGHEVLLISFKRQYPRWLFPGKTDRDPSKKPLEVEEANYWIDSLNPFSWLTTFWRIVHFKPDKIIMQWWTTFWTPVWLFLGTLNRLCLRAPLIFICHNVLPHETHWWDPWLVRLALRWSTRLVVQSVSERQRLTDIMPKASIDVIPHPVYDMFAHQRMSRETARRRLGLPADAPVLLFFGIVREYKGLEDLLVALPEIRRELNNAILVVAGEFWEKGQHYLQMIRELELEQSVVVVDRYILNEEVAIYFSAADVVVAPYRRATGSGVVRMAQGFGVPIITTEACMDEPIAPSERQTCFLVPSRNPEQLARAALQFFSETPDLGARSQIPDRQEGLSWQVLVEGLLAND